MRVLGFIIICVGLLTLVLPYVTFTKREKILDIGPVEAVAERRERIPVSPILGTIIFVAGAGIVIASMRKNRLVILKKRRDPAPNPRHASLTRRHRVCATWQQPIILIFVLIGAWPACPPNFACGDCRSGDQA